MGSMESAFDKLQERVRGGDRTVASILKMLADMPGGEAETWPPVYNQSGDTADRTSNANADMPREVAAEWVPGSH